MLPNFHPHDLATIFVAFVVTSIVLAIIRKVGFFRLLGIGLFVLLAYAMWGPK